jgi:IS30 family transposase
MACHLTSDERDRIAQLRFQGFNQEEIARAIGRCPTTVSRELRRNCTRGVYHAAAAQRKAERRRAERPLVRKMDRPEINERVRIGLVNEWSPEQIAGRLKQQSEPSEQAQTEQAQTEQAQTEQAQTPQTISPQTIYTWIDSDEQRDHWKSFLRRRGKRSYRRKPTLPSDAARIKERPEVIEERLRLGDFEGDTLLGPAGTGGLATLVDRKSRFTIVAKVRSKDADHVHGQIKRRLKELDEEHRRSITFDRGTEFARCGRLEKHLGMKIYFADPGRPYQRGTNENTNGLIRQYFPKGTDFRDVTHYEAHTVERRLNNRPRKCLGFRTPAEVFFEKTPPSGCD